MTDPTDDLTALEQEIQAAMHEPRIGMSENLVGPFPCHCGKCERYRRVQALIARSRKAEAERDAAASLIRATSDESRWVQAMERNERLEAERDALQREVERLREALVSLKDRIRPDVEVAGWVYREIATLTPASGPARREP